MNVFTFSGRLARDAEVRHTPSGNAVCTFTVANDIGYGDRKTTNWIKCDLWGKRAEGGLPQHLVKGAQVVVTGEVTLDEFRKRDGTNAAALRVRVMDVDLICGRDSGAQNGNRAPQRQSAPQPEPPYDPMDDDIPF